MPGIVPMARCRGVSEACKHAAEEAMSSRQRSLPGILQSGEPPLLQPYAVAAERDSDMQRRSRLPMVMKALTASQVICTSMSEAFKM